MSDDTEWERMDMDDLLDAAHDGDTNAGLEIAVREVKKLRAALTESRSRIERLMRALERIAALEPSFIRNSTFAADVLYADRVLPIARAALAHPGTPT